MNPGALDAFADAAFIVGQGGQLLTTNKVADELLYRSSGTSEGADLSGLTVQVGQVQKPSLLPKDDHAYDSIQVMLGAQTVLQARGRVVPMRHAQDGNAVCVFVRDAADQEVDRGSDVDAAPLFAHLPAAVCRIGKHAQRGFRFVFFGNRTFNAPIFDVFPYGEPVDEDVFLRHVHADDRARFMETLEISESGRSFWQAQFRLVDGERGDVWMHGRALPIQDIDGGTQWHGLIVEADKCHLQENCPVIWHCTAHQDTLEKLRSCIALHDAQIEDLQREIASNLHGQLGPLLSAAKMRFEMFSQKPQVIDSAELEEIVGMMNQALDLTRKASWHLYPPVLNLGLAPAIMALGEDFGVMVEVQILPADLPQPSWLTSRQAREVYGIAVEALSNSSKHAGASAVRMRMVCDANGLLLEVSDNGTGFDEAKHTGALRFGLFNMQERALRLQAKLTIDSRIDLGTTVALRMAVPGTH